MKINSRKSTLLGNKLVEAQMTLYQDIFPFEVKYLKSGYKYLGFQLKLNSYLKLDWLWLLAKLEKRLKVWSYRWLSRTGRLVLVKSVLEAILVYGMALAWIPKGVLEKVQRICFKFLGQALRKILFSLG
jgi:hypothetical protein